MDQSLNHRQCPHSRYCAEWTVWGKALRRTGSPVESSSVDFVVSFFVCLEVPWFVLCFLRVYFSDFDYFTLNIYYYILYWSCVSAFAALFLFFFFLFISLLPQKPFFFFTNHSQIQLFFFFFFSLLFFICFLFETGRSGRFRFKCVYYAFNCSSGLTEGAARGFSSSSSCSKSYFRR